MAGGGGIQLLYEIESNLTSHYIKQKLDHPSTPKDFHEGSTERSEQHLEFHLRKNWCNY